MVLGDTLDVPLLGLDVPPRCSQLYFMSPNIFWKPVDKPRIYRGLSESVGALRTLSLLGFIC